MPNDFFKKYKVLLDFNNERVGISGKSTVDFSQLHQIWLENKPIFDLDDIKKEKILMLLGLIFGCLIILLVLYYAFKGSKEDKAMLHKKFFEEADNAVNVDPSAKNIDLKQTK